MATLLEPLPVLPEEPKVGLRLVAAPADDEVLVNEPAGDLQVHRLKGRSLAGGGEPAAQPSNDPLKVLLRAEAVCGLEHKEGVRVVIEWRGLAAGYPVEGLGSFLAVLRL